MLPVEQGKKQQQNQKVMKTTKLQIIKTKLSASKYTFGMPKLAPANEPVTLQLQQRMELELR